MSNTETPNKLGKIFFSLASLMTLMQTILLAMPPLPNGNVNPAQVTLGSITMVLSVIFTLLQQKFSIKIDNKAMGVTWIVLAISLLSTANDMNWIAMIPMSDYARLLTRWIITGLSQVLAFFSKEFYPSDIQKQIKFEKKLQKDRE